MKKPTLESLVTLPHKSRIKSPTTMLEYFSDWHMMICFFLSRNPGLIFCTSFHRKFKHLILNNIRWQSQNHIRNYSEEIVWGTFFSYITIP